MLKRIILRFYNEGVESLCTRLLYFMNTVDSYFLVAGTLSYLTVSQRLDPIPLIMILLFCYICFKVSDFFPYYLFFTPIFVLAFYSLKNFSLLPAIHLVAVNILIFVLIQILFMGIPDSIVARDFSIPLRKVWNSLFTIAPTTVSFGISVYFSTFLSMLLYFQPVPYTSDGFLLWGGMFLSAFITRLAIPRTFVSRDFKPPQDGRVAERVILLNIDGMRLDRFYEARMPFMRWLEKNATYFPRGLKTVYRALTNPAFASILTGTTPDIHGVVSNNLGQMIKVDALPDMVKTRLYGSMHVRHFSKPHWDTRIVSLPTNSIYKSDDIMFGWLREDLLKDDGTRLFIADISEVDFLGHAYGSESWEYLEALERTDARIGDFYRWCEGNGLLRDSVVIICSDHGIKGIDHSYLLWDAEVYVPFFMTGPKVKRGEALNFEASIMDIAPTVSFILGIPYPAHSSGRVFYEGLVDSPQIG